MWRYMLMFLLVNTYGRSFGTPVKSPVWNPNLFNDLANRCKNDFVSSLIAMKSKDCNVTSPLLQDVQLRCLVFYDASNILCDIPDTTFPNLAKDFAAKTSDKQNVTNFCSESAQFNISQTSNHEMMIQIFKKDVVCLNVCVDENLLSGDTNFVCKYYKWMLTVLQSLHTSVHATGQIVETSDKATGAETRGISSAGTINEVATLNGNNSSTKVQEPETDANKVQGGGNITSTQLSNVGAVLSGADHSTVSGVKNQQINQIINSNQLERRDNKTVHGNNLASGLNNNGGPIGESNPAGLDSAIELPGGANAGDDDDNGDTGEDRDDNEDGEGDDGDDHPDDMNPKPINEQPANEQPANEQPANEQPANEKPATFDDRDGHSFDKDYSLKYRFPDEIPEAFVEDDDHFFPFFLTAVVVVVVLYVLYHNKNKVAKMFFGLIVEGRQPGRRRNSRGHTYRRLDTLEQAMSANTPAPPSKIIY